MSEPIIQVENLCKRYRIGTREQGYTTLREAIVSGITAPFRNFRNLRRLTRFSDNGDSPKPDAPQGEPEPALQGEPSSSKSTTANTLPDDTIWALRDVSFSVTQGEIVGIIGRNGAGKSTLLKILSRITPPTSGEVRIQGRVASLLEVGTGFHPELTGRENIFLNGAMLGMTRSEIRSRFDEIVAFSEVEKFIDTPVKRYSSGMYVRLAFSVAAHLEAEILIVDEVLAVGDSAFQKKCLGKMGEATSRGRTVLFVSHNIAAIKTLCGRAILLQDGAVSCMGAVSEVVDAYALQNMEEVEQSNPVTITKQRQKGTLDVSIVRAGMQSLSGEWKRNFSVWEPFVINLEIESRQDEAREVNCWFALQTSDGDYMGTSIQYDQSPPVTVVIEPYDRICVKAVCADNLLKPGLYFLAVGVLGKYKQIHDWCDKVLSFEITPDVYQRGLYDGRVGNMALRSRWEFERLC